MMSRARVVGKDEAARFVLDVDDAAAYVNEAFVCSERSRARRAQICAVTSAADKGVVGFVDEPAFKVFFVAQDGGHCAHRAVHQ